MKTYKSLAARAALAILIAAFMTLSAAAANLGPVKVNDRLGNGWHMQTDTYVSEEGLVSGITKITNYNNAFGFTGGLFVVVMDQQMQPIYSSPLHKWGINAAGFSSKKVRTEMWTEQIPAEVLGNATSMAVVQQHTPTYRVWVWIYDHRDLLIEKARKFIVIFKKIQDNQLTEEDVWDAVNSVAEILAQTGGDSWALNHAQELCQIVRDIRDLAAELDGWKPRNHDDIKAVTEMLVNIARQDFDWRDQAKVKQLVDSVIGLIDADRSAFVPENVYKLRAIVEELYVLCKDERVPDDVQEIIQNILDNLNKVP